METKINMKMEKSAYKSKLLVLLTATLISFSLAAQEASKEYHKEFKADKNTTLDLNTKYGDVSVTGWDKDQIVIDVKVTVRHPDKAKAEKYLTSLEGKELKKANVPCLHYYTMGTSDSTKRVAKEVF